MQEDSVTTPRSSSLNGLVFIFSHISCSVLWYNLFEGRGPFDGRTYVSLLTGNAWSYLLVLIALFDRDSITKCISSAARVYCITSSHSSRLDTTIFLTLISFGTSFLHIVVSSYSNVNRLVFTILNHLSAMPIVATCLLISNLCFICERAYKHLNDQLAELSKCHLSPRILCQLEVLSFQFELVTDFMEEIARCFGLALATILTEFTLRLIFLSYYMSRSLPSIADYNFETHVGMSILLLTIYSIKFVMICKCSQQIQNQVKLMSVNLYNLRVLWVNCGDNNLQTMLSDFSDSVESTSAIYLTAAGFTEIDLLLLFKLIGTAMIYASATIGITSRSSWKTSENI